MLSDHTDMRTVESATTTRRKNLNIDQRKIKRARRILGTETETETIARPLDLVVFRREILQSLAHAKGRGGVTRLDAD